MISHHYNSKDNQSDSETQDEKTSTKPHIPAELHTPTTEEEARPADWYSDPEDPSQYRWWDGSSWTEHRSDKYFEDDEAPPLKLRTIVTQVSSFVKTHWQVCIAVVCLILLGEVVSVTLLDYGFRNSPTGDFRAELDNVFSDFWESVTAPETNPQNEATSNSWTPPSETGWIFAAALVNIIVRSIAWSFAVLLILDAQRASTGRLSVAFQQSLKRMPKLFLLYFKITLIASLFIVLIVAALSVQAMMAMLLVSAAIPLIVLLAVILPIAYIAIIAGPKVPPVRYAIHLLSAHPEFYRLIFKLLLILAALKVAGFYMFVGIERASSDLELADRIAEIFSLEVILTPITALPMIVFLMGVAVTYKELGGEINPDLE
ncbi:MAG: DUF2510 domain-containing protein [Acidimicrobiaceae bacterium]|nr:DUF2510 domain-containing protein [Acidimicrobiaceae bacterium]